MLLQYLKTSLLIRSAYAAALVLWSLFFIERLGIDVDEYIFSSLINPDLWSLSELTPMCVDAACIAGVMLGHLWIADMIFRIIRSNIWALRAFLTLTAAFDHHLTISFVAGMACVTVFLMWVEAYPPFQIGFSVTKLLDATATNIDPHFIKIDPTTGLQTITNLFDVGVGDTYLPDTD